MKVKSFFQQNWKYFVAGTVIGLVAITLTILGNPKNMGFCIACFLRDSAGALGMHSNDKVQYMRPEVIGIVLGAFGISLIRREHNVQGGSAPLTRFVMGMAVMIGALVFLGCPLRMVLRMGGGDLNALIGLAGFVGGIGVGVVFLNKGFTLKRSYKLPKLEGLIAPAASLSLLAVLIISVASSVVILVFSTTGPGSLHAPIWAALIGGLVVGAIGQVVRVCFAGGIRDSIMFKQFGMLMCIGILFVTVIIANLITGDFNLGMKFQPVSHTQVIWNILGLFVVGLGSVLLGGCPFRQLVLTGSGNTDSAISVLGMVAGAALAHNLGLASGADNAGTETLGGATVGGKIAIFICIAVLLVIGILNTRRVAAKNKTTLEAEI